MESLYQKTLSAILNFLSYRERSFKEIDNKLKKYLDKQKNFDQNQKDEVYNKVVLFLRENGLINDFSFGKNLVLHYINSKKPYGKIALLSKLTLKGINKSEAQEIVNSLVDNEKEGELAYKAFLQRYKNPSLPLDLATKRKISAYLAGRGFSKSAINFVISKIDK